MVGRIIVSIFGLAWSLITFLVIPVLVVEGVGVREAISRSSEMFRRTWGENVLAQVGIGLIAFLLVIPGVVLIAIGGGSGSEGMLLTMVAVAMLWFILLALVMAALNGIFQTALYRYAAGMPVGGAFDGDVLSNAFAPRKS